MSGTGRDSTQKMIAAMAWLYEQRSWHLTLQQVRQLPEVRKPERAPLPGGWA